jgi:Na+/H+ antiporter NhaD/arsenite permease-like protein
MTHTHHDGGNPRTVVYPILAVVFLYAIALVFGWPQRGTRPIVAEGEAHQAVAAAHEAPAAVGAGSAPSMWTVIPFMLLLGAIAVLPLIPALSHWWESNRNRFLVAMVLAAVALAYYAFLHRSALEGHWPAHHRVEPTSGPLQVEFVRTILENAILQEFVPFIVLLFSLFTISGGIRITGDLQAHPMTNATMMAVGAILASFIGTTGAAMLLIRPLLETNRERKHVAHTIVIFIFIVCNCGGCLLPIGDPPLFLGYLQGVPFLWTWRLWHEWVFVNASLLVIYLLLDQLWYYRRETLADIRRDVTEQRRLRISGWEVNVPLLMGVVLAVALLDPSKPLPGTNWHPWMYLREVTQLALVAASLWWGNQKVRRANRFNYSAILEVAALFSGIFITMQPALQILGERGDELGLRTPAHFFWVTGGLSSVLDNAPTYLVFFQTAKAMPASTDATVVAGVEETILTAISLGAVFMGAMTYIGNGPNFMVRAIAESSGVKMPSFFGYMVYSFLILLPLLAVMVWQYLM